MESVAKAKKKEALLQAKASKREKVEKATMTHHEKMLLRRKAEAELHQKSAEKQVKHKAVQARQQRAAERARKMLQSVEMQAPKDNVIKSVMKEKKPAQVKKKIPASKKKKAAEPAYHGPAPSKAEKQALTMAVRKSGAVSVEMTASGE